jgi:hypothetical protein
MVIVCAYEVRALSEHLWEYSSLLVRTGCYKATFCNKIKLISHRNIIYLLAGKGKGKADPLQAWSGPEGSRKLRFPDFMTTAQDGGKVVSLTHRPPLPL